MQNRVELAAISSINEVFKHFGKQPYVPNNGRYNELILIWNNSLGCAEIFACLIHKVQIPWLKESKNNRLFELNHVRCVHGSRFSDELHNNLLLNLFSQ